MKHFFSGPLQDHPRNILRHLGYAEQRTRRGQISYTARAGAERFPRYHAYVEDRDGGMQINLHVDQRAATYGDGTAHGGEYEGPLVEREMHRIKQFMAGLQQPPKPQQPSTTNKKESKGFWGNLFG